jgi:hypothetical protein
MFYFSKDTFDTIPISMFFISEIEAVTTTGVFQRVRAVDEKHGDVNSIHYSEFNMDSTQS